MIGSVSASPIDSTHGRASVPTFRRLMAPAWCRLSQLRPHHHSANHPETAARNKALWRSSVMRHARSAAQYIVVAAWQLRHVTKSCRIAGSTIRDNAKLAGGTLSHADNAESERAAARNKPLWRRSSVMRNARSAAQYIVVAAWRLHHVTKSCPIAGTVRS